VTDSQDTSGAGRSAQPSPLPIPAPSFARRHPFYAAFGVLAALSLFSAFWPLSALVTGALVAARATGLDRRALHGVATGGRWLVRRITSTRGAPPPAQPPEAGPAVQRESGVIAREELQPARAPELHRTQEQRSAHRASARRRGPVETTQRDRVLPGL